MYENWFQYVKSWKLFGSLSLFNGISTFVFNANVILVEGQLVFYVTSIWSGE